MQLFVHTPVFTKAGAGELELRLRNFHAWVTTDRGRERLRATYGFSRIDAIGLAPNQEFPLMRTSPNPFKIVHPLEPNALVPKGLLIRLHILKTLEKVDEADPSNRDDAVFALIDGSGAFEFDNLFLVLDALLALPGRREVALGRRPAGDTGMPDWRKTIENFEHCLLLSRWGDRLSQLCLSGPDLHDGQAGCWAIRLSAMKSLPLTALGYELEFDLLASTLAGNLPFAFTEPLKMAPRRASEFGGTTLDSKALEASVRKLRFIKHRLSLSPEEVLSLLDTFVAESLTTGCELPAAYVSAVRTAEA
jgi:hypothetical protein